jgi:hypothetical protein
LALRDALVIATVSYFLGTSTATRRAVVSPSPNSLAVRQAQQQRDLPQEKGDVTTTLIERVGEPAQSDIDAFKKAGMQDVWPHTLTADERIAVQVPLASLPALNKRVLERHLHRLVFVDGIPGEGTGLTSRNAKRGLSDITLRAGVINESLTAFLTNNLKLMDELTAAGVQLVVCGQSVFQRHINLHTIQPDVQLNLSATVTLMNLETQGYMRIEE